MKVMVLGAGTMGSGIAQAFALSGYQVIVRDLEQAFVDKGIAGVAKSLDRIVAKGNLSDGDRKAALARLSGTTDLATAAEVDLVVEAAVENMAIKKAVFAELDGVCKPEAILATNTSSLSITEIASATKRPDK
ncbi:MAG TPA: 3-hydroxyacyl-CoA dehydrogenase NAD-binding domain-containing protein, partial [Spirochaetales bacterium]|nr:3-hydroxyacyl-CoA dehydrogenase NAD-binding domain-containing protein [Spirochaetales bacterium]